MPPLSGPKKPSSSLVGPLRRSPLRQDGWRLFGSRRLSRWDPLASRTGNGKKKISHIRLTPRSPVTREIERTLALALLLLPSLRGVAAPAGARREDRRRGWSRPPPRRKIAPIDSISPRFLLRIPVCWFPRLNSQEWWDWGFRGGAGISSPRV